MKYEKRLSCVVSPGTLRPVAGLGAIACALAAFACGGEEPIPPASDERPSAPGRPSQVPAEYVPTANGYMHPSCIVELAPGEEVVVGSEDGMEVRGADGRSRRLGRCAYPRFRSNGEIIPAPASTRPSDEPNLPERRLARRPRRCTRPMVKLLSRSRRCGRFGRCRCCLPETCRSLSWPGLQPASGPGWVLQPILESFANEPWYIKACYYDASTGMFPCLPSPFSSRLYVNPNDYIVGVAIGSNCNASTGVCGTWTVQIADWNTGQVSDPLPVSGFTQKADRVIAADLELFGITSCDQLPAGPLPNFTTQVQGFDDVWRIPSWEVRQPPSGPPNCKYDSWVVRNARGNRRPSISAGGTGTRRTR